MLIRAMINIGSNDIDGGHLEAGRTRNVNDDMAMNLISRGFAVEVADVKEAKTLKTVSAQPSIAENKD
jgi:hypothetical protein